MESTRDHEFIERAIRLAESRSTDGRHGPFGAVIVRGDTLVGEGWNRVVASRDPTAHAEVTAIRDACRNLDTHLLRGCTLYSSCEPCPMCLAAIYWARIDRIVFACLAEDAARAGFDDADIDRELRLDWAERRLPSTRLGRDSALRVFEKWNANPNRIDY